MSAEKAVALVIRQVDFSESSRVLTLYTREFGKVGVMAKGARRLKGPFEVALDLLTEVDVVMLRKSSGGLDLLTEARLKRRFQPAPGDLLSLYGGYYLAELLESLSVEDDPQPLLYDAAVATLDQLSRGGHSPAAVLRFELILLRELGQLPALEACLGCDQPFPNSGTVAFQASQGGFFCPQCREHVSGVQLVSPHSLSRMAELAEPERPLEDIPLDRPRRAEIRGVLTACIAHILGRKPKTLRYLPFS
jgi:DNA repair protein RecO (recombination protein O)